MVEFGDAASLGRILEFGHILEHQVDEIVEAEQSADDLFVAAHDDVNARTDALVDKLERQQLRRIAERYILQCGGHC